MADRKFPTKPILKFLIWAYWQEARWTTILVIIATIGGSIAAVATPYLFSRAIDNLTGKSNTNEALRILLLYALLYGIAKALQQASRFLVFLCAERLGFEANSALFARLLRKTPDFFAETNQVEIGNARREGAHTLNIATQLVIGGLLPGAVQIVFAIVLLGSFLNWETASIITLYGIVVIFLDYLRIGRVRTFLDAAMSRSQENAMLAGNAFAIIDTVRQTRGEAWISNLFSVGAEGAFQNWRRYALVSSAFCGILGIAATLQVAVTFLILIPQFDAGLLSIGDIVLFNALLLQLSEPFHLIGMAIKEGAEAAARFQPLAKMWHAPELVDPENHLEYTAAEGTIIFEDVTFLHHNGRGVANLSFVARRGTPTFITGETGSGKSTVLKLLLKSLAPTEGRILVDGVDLSQVKSKDWFAHVGVVPQDVILLNGTICTNIVLGRRVDTRRLWAAAEQASILKQILAMPMGFDTIVGERGLNLSGGERQRIAIARALYGDPRILILDEASSALDVSTEREIMDRIRCISSNLTVLLVTHRDSIIHKDDQIISLSMNSAEGST